MKPERYFSIDIEAAGPIPGTYSMLSLGACAVDDPTVAFYVELQPINMAFVPEALAVSGFNMQRLLKEGQAPSEAMQSFRSWVDKERGDAKAVFVGFNACFDWQFINWYLESFAGGNPLGFGGVDIKSYFMGLRGVSWLASSSSQLPPEFQPDTAQTHNALDDARAQASMFAKMLKEASHK